MNNHHRQVCLLACAVALLGMQASAGAQTDRAGYTTYSVANLGVGWPIDVPKINNKGQVAFSVRNGSGDFALFYDGQTAHDIGNLGANGSYVAALNDAGQVVGRSHRDAGEDINHLHAYRWSLVTGMVDLGSLPQTRYAMTADINNRGEVAGTSTYYGRIIEPYHAVRWDATGAILDLGTLYGSSGAAAINDAGQIVGNVDLANGNTHTFLWTRQRGMLDLGALGSGVSSPVDINASGQVTGDSAVVRNGDTHAYIWKPTQRMTDLGTLGGTLSRAADINDAGQVVGFSTTARGNEHAFLWNGAGRMIDLGTLGGADSRATQINRYGTVVGGAMTRGGRYHGVAWTRAGGLVDLNSRLRGVPPGLVVDYALGVGDDGAIVASSNAGLVVLKPGAGSPAAPATPVIGPMTRITAGLGAPLAAAARFVDANVADTHRATWTWGDGSKPEAAKVSERSGAGIASGAHSYRQEGVYIVVLTVTDSSGRQASAANMVWACPAGDASCIR